MIKYNLGSGDKPLSGFINVDEIFEYNPDLVGNIVDFKFAQPPDIIYSSHALQCIFPRGLQSAALYHWVDSLVVGGYLILVVPNAEYQLQKLASGKDSFTNTRDSLFGWDLPGLRNYNIYSFLELQNHFNILSFCRQCSAEESYQLIDQLGIPHPPVSDILFVVQKI